MVDDFDSDSVGDENKGTEICDNAPPKTIRKASPPAQPRGKACPPAQLDGMINNGFSPTDVVSEIDVEMETD
eukprot:4715156-Pyramimonas_sp.AAC.1